VAACGGSLSGEHGDGRVRGELLGRMYGPPTMAAFRALRRRLDPDGILNPGVLVDAEPLDAGLRALTAPPPPPSRTAVGFARVGGLGRAALACNGNGACRKRTGTMCPSYQALGDERHATRGRAVLLRAALEGRLPGGLADDGLHEALELCLGCKACAAECPASVDMARLKTEALAHRHRDRGVPPLARLAGEAHALLAAGSRAPALARAGAAVAGRVLGRRVPAPVARWRPAPRGDGRGEPVVLLSDTFTRHLHPEVGDAAVAVLEAAGAAVTVVDPGCCGRPLLSQGLVGRARRSLSAAVARLAPYADAGVAIVVLEPSCWSMLVDDAETLLPGDPAAAAVARAAEPFERTVLRLGPPPLRPLDADAVVHPHCHARALGGGDDPLRLVTAVPGLRARPSGAGCCGMAGAFGLRHPALSRRIGEDRLAPAARTADLVVAHGSSCRQQVEDLTATRAVHPALLVAGQLA
jgi:Fe-S oxidoreductase